MLFSCFVADNCIFVSRLAILNFLLKDGYHHALRLLDAITLLRGRCSRHNSPPAGSGMQFIICYPDSSHVSVDTVHPSLFYSSSSPRWYHLHCLSSGVLLFSSLHVSKPSPLSIFRRIIILTSSRVQTISIVYLPAYYYSHLFKCPNHLHCLSSGVLLFSSLYVSKPSPLSVFRRAIILISLRVQTISIVCLPAYYYSHLFTCPNHIHCLSSGVLLFSSLYVSKPPLSVFRRYYSHLFTCPNHLHCLSSGVLLFSSLYVSKPSPLSVFRRYYSHLFTCPNHLHCLSSGVYYSHLFTCPNHLHCLSSGVLLFSPLHVSKPSPLSIFRRIIILTSSRVQTISIVCLPAYYYSHLFTCPNHLHCLSSGVLLFSSLHVSKPSPLSVFRRIIILISLRVQTISIVCLPAYYYSHLFTCPNHLHCLSSGVLLFSSLYVSKPSPLSVFRRIIILTSSRVQTISIVCLPACYYSHLFTCPNHLHCLSSGVLLFSPLHVSKPSPLSVFRSKPLLFSSLYVSKPSPLSVFRRYYSHLFTCPNHLHCLSSGVLLFSSLYVSKPYPLSIFRRIIILISLRVQTISIVCLPAYYYSHLFTCPNHLHCLSSGVLLFSSLYVSKPSPLSVFRRIIILISLRVQTISIVYLPAYYYSHLFTCPNHIHCLSSGVLLFSSLYVSKPSPLSIFRRIIILISLRVQTISIVCLPAYYYSHLFTCPNHLHCLSSGVLLFSPLHVSKPSPLSVFRRLHVSKPSPLSVFRRIIILTSSRVQTTIILISLRVQTISIVCLPAYYYSHLFACPNHLHCLSSGVLLFSSLYVSKPSPLSVFRRIIILISLRVQTISIVCLPAYYYSHLFTCPNHLHCLVLLFSSLRIIILISLRVQTYCLSSGVLLFSSLYVYYYSHLFTCPNHIILHCLSSGVLLFSSLHVSKPSPLSVFRRIIILISLRVQTISIVCLPAYYYSHLFTCPNHLHCLSSGVLLFSSLYVSKPSPLSVFRRIIILISLRVQTISIVCLPAYYYSHLFACPNHLHCLSSGVLLFSSLYVSKPSPLSVFRRIIILISLRVQTISIVCLPACYYSHLFACPNHLHCLSSGVLLFSSLCVSKPSPLSVFRRAIILISLRVQTISIVCLPAYYYSHLFACPNHLCLAFLHLSVMFCSFSLSTMSLLLT